MKKIRLTESQFNKLIRESVRKALNEGVGTVQDLRKAHDILKGISESGYIPFASPNPSGTENEIKKAIIEAMRLIDKACYLDTQCYGHEPMVNLV